MLEDVLIKNNIKVSTSGEKCLKILGKSSEFVHIIINLISNSTYAFNDKKVQGPKISIDIVENSEHVEIFYQDNAGGIPEDIIDKIFIANYTTKDEKEGNGIGLYIGQKIIDKKNGDIIAYNKDDGVFFKLIFTKS